MFSFVLCVVLTVSFYQATDAAGPGAVRWSYDEASGPSHWPALFAECGKMRQSPINIDTANTVFDAKLDPIQLSIEKPQDVDPNRLRVTNNGHTVNLGDLQSVIRLTGGDLGRTFRVAGVHFHWGSNDSTGSEHTIDNKHFPLEMHMVSYNEHYDTVFAALNQSDGLAVVGLLFEISQEDNPLLTPLIAILNQVADPGHPANLSNYDFTKLLPSQSHLNNYYRYLGSLTTPPCYESVTWTVLNDISTVSASQLQQFRSLHQHAEEGHGAHAANMENNWRPVQPLNGRVVTRSFQFKPEHPIVKDDLRPEHPIVKDTLPAGAGNSASTNRNQHGALLLVALIGYTTLRFM